MFFFLFFCNQKKGDEFGLKDDLIFCRHHFLEQQSYDSQLTDNENRSISGFHDDSGYYTSSIPSTNTSAPTESTVHMTKRTRKRKERELISSSDRFLTVSPTSSTMSMFFQLDRFYD